MKKSLILGVGGVLLFTGCCCKEGGVYNCNGKSNTSHMLKQKLPVKKINKVRKPLVIKKMQFGNQVCYIENGYKKSCMLKLEGRGVGVAPCNGTCSVAKAKVMARRAAVIDAYRALAEEMYGIRINGRDTVKNMVLQNSTIRSYVDGLIRGAHIIDESYKNGIYSVTMDVTIDPAKWNQYLNTISF